VSANIQLDLVTPSVPNFVVVRGLVGGGDVHSVQAPQIDVADLDDDKLRELGKLWTIELIQNAARRRTARKDAVTIRKGAGV
jgi:hypothetical protein